MVAASNARDSKGILPKAVRLNEGTPNLGRNVDVASDSSRWNSLDLASTAPFVAGSLHVKLELIDNRSRKGHKVMVWAGLDHALPTGAVTQVESVLLRYLNLAGHMVITD